MASDLIDLTGGLYRFLVAAEPQLLARRPGNGETLTAFLERARALLAGFAEARERATERLATALADVQRSLHELVARLEARRAGRRELRDVWKALGQSYEELVQEIKQRRMAVPRGITLGKVKPRNLWRNAFHVSMGTGGVALYEWVMTRDQILALAFSILGFFVVLDITRRIWPRFNEILVRTVFGKIIRPDEHHRVPSATWYMAGLALGVVLLPQRAIEVGVLVLAFGDPAAALAGKRWGSRKLFLDRSLAGMLGFVVAALLASAAFLTVLSPGLGAAAILAVAVGAAVTGALVELFTVGLDDNLTIPLLAGAMAALLL